MPTAPLYQPFQVQEQALPRAQAITQAPQGAFGDGRQVTQEAGKILDEKQAFFLKEKEKADKVQVLDAYNKAMDSKRYWTRDDKAGFLNLRGKDVLPKMGPDSGIRDDPANNFSANFNKDLDEIEKGLGTPEQIAAFQEIKSRMTNQFSEDIAKHVFAESYKHEESTYQSGITNLSEDSAQHPENAIANKKAIDELVSDFGKSRGFDDVKIKNTQKATNSSAFMGIVDKMIAQGNSAGGKEVFKLVDEHDGWVKADELTLIKALRVGSNQQFAQDKGAEIVGKGLSLYASTQLAREMVPNDPDKLGALKSEIEQIFSRRERSRHISQTRLSEHLGNRIMNGEHMSDFTDRELRGLEPKARAGLAMMDKKKTELGFVPTKPKYKFALQRMALDNPKEFINTNLYDYAGVISQEDLGDLWKFQMGDQEVVRKLALGMRSDHQIMDAASRTAGINKKSKSDTEKKMADELDAKIDASWALDVIRNDGPISNDRKIELAKQMATEVILKKSHFGDTTKQLYEIQKHERFDLRFEDIDWDTDVQDAKKYLILKEGFKESDFAQSPLSKKSFLSERTRNAIIRVHITALRKAAGLGKAKDAE